MWVSWTSELPSTYMFYVLTAVLLVFQIACRQGRRCRTEEWLEVRWFVFVGRISWMNHFASSAAVLLENCSHTLVVTVGQYWWRRPCCRQCLLPSSISSRQDVSYHVHTAPLVRGVSLLLVHGCETICHLSCNRNSATDNSSEQLKTSLHD